MPAAAHPWCVVNCRPARALHSSATTSTTPFLLCYAGSRAAAAVGGGDATPAARPAASAGQGRAALRQGDRLEVSASLSSLSVYGTAPPPGSLSYQRPSLKRAACQPQTHTVLRRQQAQEATASVACCSTSALSLPEPPTKHVCPPCPGCN